MFGILTPSLKLEEIHLFKNKDMIATKYNKMWSLLITIVIVAVGNSCRKFADPALIFEKEPENVVSKARKVLVISVDGLSGMELERYVPANIEKILVHSKYTFSGIADASTGDASTWATLLSGKTSTKHGVYGNSFDEDVDEDDPHGHNASGQGTGYITFFQRLLEQGKRLHSFSATSWKELDENAMAYAESRILKANDEEVMQASIDTLKSLVTDVSFGVINFRSVNEAGMSGGFSIDNPAYKASIDKIDAYIGDIKAAIESRPSYQKEDWMIVVTSNHAGIGKSYGGASFEERTVPIILYNTNFVGQKFEAPAFINSMVIRTKDANVPMIPAANTDIYDIKDGGEYTIMCKVKNNVKPGTTSHAVILGRVTHAYTGGNGWAFMIEGANTGKYRFYLADKNASNNQLQVLGAVAKDIGVWESLAVKIYKKDDGKRYAKFYVNGVAGSERDITTGRGSFQSPTANLFVGSGNVTSVGTFDGMVNNLVFVPKALSDEEIESYTCMATVDESTSFWSKTTGFWPMDEVGQRVFKNKKTTDLNTDFQFPNGSYNWSLHGIWNCLSEQENAKFFILNQYDIVPQLAYWMNVKPEDAWLLEGKVFLDKYEQEFIAK